MTTEIFVDFTLFEEELKRIKNKKTETKYMSVGQFLRTFGRTHNNILSIKKRGKIGPLLCRKLQEIGMNINNIEKKNI